MREPVWVVGCPKCGGEVRVLHGVIMQTQTCDNCKDFLKEEDLPGGDLQNEIVSTELGWCGCGNPEEVDRMMLEYLRSRAVEGFPKPPPAEVTEDAAMLLAYLADKLDWTEHGGSVGGAWLTDHGKVALANLEKYEAARKIATVNGESEL